MKKKILLLEDDSDLARMVSLYLVKEKFEVQVCGDGGYAQSVIHDFQPDLILLDLMLPGLTGLEILKNIRQSSAIPIIITSAKETEVDRVVGLRLGADDYVTKPFSIKELLARIEALFRRVSETNFCSKEKIVTFQDVSINRRARIVFRGTQEIHLTMKEFDLLVFLVEHPQQVFSKEQLYQQVWEFDKYGEINTVAIHIQKIREKIGDNHRISTVRGVGYRFDGEFE